MSIDGNGHFDSSECSDDATEARLGRLDSAKAVRKARARAEVEFRTAEVAGAADWQSARQDLDVVTTPPVTSPLAPHWQAGVRYACDLIFAYGKAALDHVEPPTDFEAFLRQCVWIVAATTYQRKLLPYEAVSAAELPRAVESFYQFVRTAAGARTAELGLEAWKRNQQQLEADPGAGTEDLDHLGAGLARDREARLQAFLLERGATVAAVRVAARVRKPDMQRWRQGKLSRQSVMAQRIEEVLSGEIPLTGTDKMAG